MVGKEESVLPSKSAKLVKDESKQDPTVLT